MKLNTHDRTPRPQNSNFIKVLFLICAILIYSIFGLVSFACFYYAHSFIGGISVILIPILLTAIILIHIKDIEKAIQYPNSAKDANGRLLVGAAVGVSKNTLERVDALVKAKVDITHNNFLNINRLDYSFHKYAGATHGIPVFKVLRVPPPDAVPHRNGTSPNR